MCTTHSRAYGMWKRRTSSIWFREWIYYFSVWYSFSKFREKACVVVPALGSPRRCNRKLKKRCWLPICTSTHYQRTKDHYNFTDKGPLFLEKAIKSTASCFLKKIILLPCICVYIWTNRHFSFFNPKGCLFFQALKFLRFFTRPVFSLISISLFKI